MIQGLIVTRPVTPIPVAAWPTSFDETTEGTERSEFEAGKKLIKNVLATQIAVSQFRTGAAMNQDTFEYGSNAASVSAGKTLLLNSTHFLNVHLMGFGPGNPQPSPGNYSWASLDTRFNSHVSGGAGIVLTGCCAPSWMKGGASDFGTGFEVAPTSDYYDDYADLVAAAVARYPQIQYVQVWNEMKGFFSSSLNRWNYEAYTQLYNQVWTKVKAVRSSVKIGGPYTPLRSNGAAHSYNSSTAKGPWGYYDQRDLDVITYWLQNKAGADFLTLDGSIKGRDGVELVGEFDRLHKYSAFMTWLRGLNNNTYPGAATLPVWWSEWYAVPDNSGDSQAKKNALMAAGLMITAKSGAQTAMIWGPEGDNSGNSWPLGIFSNTNGAGGGAATSFYATQKALKDHFSAGVGITDATSSNANVDILASSSKIMMVNKTASSQTTQVLGASFTLGAYEVTVKDVPAPAPATTPTTPAEEEGTAETTAEEAAAAEEAAVAANSQAAAEEAAPAIVTRLADAFTSDTPLTIGSVEVPAQPVRYVSLASFMLSSTGIGVLERKHIEIALSKARGWALAMRAKIKRL